VTTISELLAAMPDPEATDEHWRQICREMTGQTATAEYERGWVDGLLAAVAELKRAQHQAVDDLDTWLNRWHLCCRPCRLEGHRAGCRDCEDRTRATFGEALSGERTPAEILAGARASWESFGLGPRPGWVHLGGPPVHWHRKCTAACRAYEPGWHRIEDAIAIIETLPGDYAQVLAGLRTQAAAAPGRTAA
jgi:hypothetical protein